MKKIYLDHNATTPTRKEVLEEILPYFHKNFGNPSSLHQFGQETKKVIEKSREKLANLLNTKISEIYFTSGGTESNNLAIKGIVFSSRIKNPHIITSKIEHHAVLNPIEWLVENNFAEANFIGVDNSCKINIEELFENIKENTILISIMHANNEVGTIQPIKEISEKLKKINSERQKKELPYIYFHTDAVQTVGKIKLSVEELGINLLSLSGHKFYGPKGVGAIYIRKGTRISPLVHGGHHEREIRAGTENLPGIVGLGKAAEISISQMKQEEAHIKSLRNSLKESIKKEIDEVIILGDEKNMLDNTLNVCFKYIEGEAIVLNLDMEGIAVSSGSACSSGSNEPSHVLSAMNVPVDYIRGAVRFSLGKDNTKEEIDYTIEKLKEIVKKLREMSPLVSHKL